jgi:hypothetical protein
MMSSAQDWSPPGPSVVTALHRRMTCVARAERVVGHRAPRRPAAMTDLDVIAAGISLSVSDLWHRLCAGGLVACGTRPGDRQRVGTVAR